MPTDPHRLLVLRAVRRTGSVAAAASALHLTASGVSQHLTRLEAETGLRLVDRTRRGGGRSVQLTSAGSALADRADAVAEALAEAQREADRLRDGSRGTVRVGGFATALSQLVVPVLSRLAVSDPALQIEVLEVTAEDGVTMLLAGELDLLVNDRRSEVAHPRLREQELCRDRYRVAVPRVWPSERSMVELLGRPWVTSHPHEQSSRILEALCAEHGVPNAGRHVCAESRTMLALVAAGLGAAVVPDLTLSALPTPGVQVLDLDLGFRVLVVLSAETAREAPATARFRELLSQIAGDDVGRERSGRTVPAGATG